MAHEDADSSDEFVSEKMWVRRRKGSRLSNSHKNPGEFSPLTRDQSDALGHVTLSPIDEDDADHSFAYPASYDYDNGPQPRRTQAQEEWDEFVRTVIRELLAIAIERSTPHAKRFWTEKVRPAIRARIDWLTQQRVLRRQRRIDKEPPVVEVPLVEPTQQVAVAVERYRINMDSSEAQARLLAAFAARAFYEEQVRLVAATDIEVDETLLALQRVLSELPPERVKKMLETFGANPSLLSGDALTGLGLVLGVERANPELLPLNERDRPIP